MNPGSSKQYAQTQLISFGARSMARKSCESGSLDCIALLLFILCLLISSQAQAASILARTDRAVVMANESVNLIYEVTGNISSEPDFSALEQQFEILGRSESSSMSFDLSSGQAERKQIWNLKLFPRQTGKLIIPEISFGQDRSPPLEITVQPTAGATGSSSTATAGSANQLSGKQDVFLRVTAAPEQPYVQSRVLYKIQLYHAVSISNASLAQPTFSHQDVIAETVGEDRQFETRIDGKPYRVYERNYAIFPQRPGELIIEPVAFQAEVITGGYRGFFGTMGGNSRLLRLNTDPVKLNVRPIPADFQYPNWLPSPGVELAETWSLQQKEWPVGEPVTRTVKLTAVDVSTGQLPQFAWTELSGLKQYPDQATVEQQLRGEQLYSSLEQKVAFIPTAPGKYTLPAIRIPWWNTQTEQLEWATLPERTINVTGAAITNSVATQPIAPASQPTGLASELSTDSTQAIWPWLSLFFACAWLLTAAAWWYQSRRSVRRSANQTQPSQIQSQQTDSIAHKLLVKNVLVASQQQNPAATKTALLAWARSQWPELSPTSLSKLAAQVDKTLAEQISHLNQILYQPGQGDWQRADEFAMAFEQFCRENPKPAAHGPAKEPDNLQSLYRISA